MSRVHAQLVLLLCVREGGAQHDVAEALPVGVPVPEGGAVGVHATPDYRYNRVLFTFLGTTSQTNIEDLYDGNVGGYVLNTGDIVFQDGATYYVETGFSYPGETEPDLRNNSNVRFATPNDSAFTIGYNEIFDAFEGFYSFVPNIYLQYGRRLLSASPASLTSAWEHNTSDERCNFYGTTYPSVLETVLGDEGHTTKIFDTLQWQGTITNASGNDVEETFDTLRVHNEYQDSDIQTLLVNDNIRRRMRLWRTLIPRDNSNGDPRIRAPWTHVTLTANNTDNYKHTVKDIEYSFRPSKN